MKIKEFKLYETNIPLITPFKTALREVDSVRDVLVEVRTDEGLTGFGEAPPTAVITGETTGSIVAAIREVIAPSLIGMEVGDIEGAGERLKSCIVKNTTARAAVDMALYDLWAKSLDRPLYQALGGGRREIETDITISVNPTEEMVRDSMEAVRRGFKILKIKVGKEGMKDIERVAAIREAVGEDIVLRVDANQGWEAKEAVQIIRGMEDKGLAIELVEQPVPAHDFAGMKFITQRVATKILADESVFTAADAVRILDAGAADLINIKLMKTGGIREALKICAIAEVYGKECMIGCMLESKLSVSAAAHLAAARRVITRADLDGPALCRIDPYEGGPEYNESKILMAEAPGIGISDIKKVINKEL